MKFIAMLTLVCLLPQAASAAGPECKLIASRHERLACYDKAAAPAKSAERSRTSAPAKAEQSKYIDLISQEDVRMNARLKNICRGC